LWKDVSQADKNARRHHGIHLTRNSQDKRNETSNSDYSKIEHQMDTINLEDESKDAKILTL
jgi:hypothetical protein